MHSLDLRFAVLDTNTHANHVYNIRDAVEHVECPWRAEQFRVLLNNWIEIPAGEMLANDGWFWQIQRLIQLNPQFVK